jgi:c-di-GMP-related signal transduction protein
MGMFGDFNNKKNKKMSKEEQAKKAARQNSGGFTGYTFTQPVVISRGKKKDSF